MLQELKLCCRGLTFPENIREFRYKLPSSLAEFTGTNLRAFAHARLRHSAASLLLPKKPEYLQSPLYHHSPSHESPSPHSYQSTLSNLFTFSLYAKYLTHSLCIYYSFCQECPCLRSESHTAGSLFLLGLYFKANNQWGLPWPLDPKFQPLNPDTPLLLFVFLPSMRPLLPIFLEWVQGFGLVCSLPNPQ